MAKQTINQGTAPTGAGGDTFRTGSAKLQANDDEIYSQLGATAQGVLPAALPITKGGTGATTAATARTNLGLGTAATFTAQTSKLDMAANSLLRVGAFGLGDVMSSGTGAFEINESDPTNYPAGSGFVWSASTASPTIPAYCVGISFTRGVGVHAQILAAPSTHELYYRVRHSNVNAAAYSLYKIWTQKNTTVDSNGFIKAASPIVQLYADHIEINDEAKQQDITFEKLGIGDYLIKGSSGFALEGWYVETPKDANGNVLFSVIYTTLENGDISVKTYKKKFDFETASIIADLNNPVDITENRWIDLRLQELPQPEIEEPESATPPDFQLTGLAQAVAAAMESYNGAEQ